MVKQVNASAEGRLTLSAARAGCSGPARLVVKRRGRVVLRARLGSKRPKVLKGSRLAQGRHRLVLRVQGSRRYGRCKPRVKIRGLRVALEGREGTSDDPADPADETNGPDESGDPPPPLPGEDDETNEDADA